MTRVSGDVRTLTLGQYMAPLSAGAFSVGGVAYGWRSGPLTVQNPLTAASYAFSVSAADAMSRCKTRTSTVVVDNMAPVPTDVQPLNKVGRVVGRMEIADTIVYTFSETIDPETILAGWTGAPTNVVVRLTNNAIERRGLGLECGEQRAAADGIRGARAEPRRGESHLWRDGHAVDHGPERHDDHRHPGHGVRRREHPGGERARGVDDVAVPTDRAGNASTTPARQRGRRADPNF